MRASIFSLLFTLASVPCHGFWFLRKRQDSSNTATVDLSISRGQPKHLGSGFIYGIPEAPNQIPDHFYTDMGFNYARAGGAQHEAPSRGWIWNEYAGRFASTKSNYLTARKYGANFIILPHDIWGTEYVFDVDHSYTYKANAITRSHSNSSTVWPGTNGDWKDYDNFLNRLLGDLKSNNMLQGLVFDIWNEADLPNAFWKASQQQWINTYIRTHKRIRSDSALSGVLISGPSHSSNPSPTSTWWTTWLQQIKGNNTIPDQYSWHLEQGGDLQVDNATFSSMLSSLGMAQPKQVNINEYGTFSEQVSTGAAWYLSRLERYDAIGLRGNWLSACALFDLFGSLLGKPGAQGSTYPCTGTGYYPNGEYQVYKYYNLNMTGHRVSTTGSGDRILDVYSTVDGKKARVLTGVRLKTGTWYITVKNLSAIGLPTSGTLNIQTWAFDDKGHYGEVDGPSNRGIVGHAYSGNSVTFPIFQTTQDANTAWAFEFSA